MLVPANRVLPLNEQPIVVAVLELNPLETTPMIGHVAALLINPVVAS